MKKTRDEVNKEAKEAYFLAGGVASILNGTGTGKSKLAIDILREINPERILLLTSSERSRDYSWEFEFERWGAKDLWSKVVPECYQSVYKWEGVHFPFVLADEIDFALTDKYIWAITKNTHDNMLCLSGFVVEEKLKILEEIAPVCYVYPTQEAQKDGILNKTQFLLIEFELSNERSIMVKKKDGGHFYQSELAAYKYWEERYQKLVIANSNRENRIIEIDKLTQSDKGSVELIDERIKLVEDSRAGEASIKWATYKRKDILHTLKSSRDVTKTLLTTILTENPSNKAVVFSALTNQIDQICRYTYHSKNKKNNDNIAKLNQGEIRLLGVCDAINRAENLVGVNYLIKESYDGSETDFQQQHGRGMRLAPDQTMYFIILLPYYRNIVELAGISKEVRLPTQAVKWYNKMSKSFDMSNHRVIKMSEDYQLPPGEKLV